MGQEHAWGPWAQGGANRGELGERVGGLDRGHRDPEGDMQVRYNTTVCSSLSCQGHEADHVPLKQDDGGLDVAEDMLAVVDMLAAAASAWAWVDPQ